MKPGEETWQRTAVAAPAEDNGFWATVLFVLSSAYHGLCLGVVLFSLIELLKGAIAAVKERHAQSRGEKAARAGKA